MMPNKWHRYLGYENQNKKSSPHHLIINNCFNYNCNKKVFLLLKKENNRNVSFNKASTTGVGK